MRRAFLPWSLLSISIAPALAAPPCPPVSKVFGSGDPATTLNIVFVPSGFSDSEMERWRCAVDRILTGLLVLEPFRTYSCAISAHRIDFANCVSGTPRTSPCSISDVSCPAMAPDWGGTCETASTDAAFGAERVLEQMVGGDFGAMSRLRMDLGVTLCGGAPASCRLLAIDATGEEHVRDIASCAPAPDVVVVVANSANVAGFGTSEGSPPMVGITLEGIGTAAVTPAHLLAHELGHAFDLNDEYTTGSGPPPLCGRNVMDFTLCGADVPWTCTDPSTVGPDNCPPATVTDGCVVHGNLTGNCVACDDPKPPIGLWEGAAYRPCGRYRPQERCRMGDLVTDEYCAVCRGMIEDTLRDAGGCLPSVTEVRRLEVRRSRVFEDGSVSWEMVCRRLADAGRPCAPRDIPDLPVDAFRAEIEVDGIRGIVDLDRLVIRGERRMGSLTLERTIGADGTSRVRPRPGPVPDRPGDRLMRLLAEGPVRLGAGALSIEDTSKAGQVMVHRAWVEWRDPKGR